MDKMGRRAFLARTASIAAAVAAAGAVEKALAAVDAGFFNEVTTGYFESQFGITDDLCRRVLGRALSRGGDFADLFFEHSMQTLLLLEDGTVNRADITVALGVGIRTVRGSQVGYSHTDELTERALLQAAQTAAEIAAGQSRKPAARLVRPPVGDYYPLGQLLSNVPLGDRAALIKSVNDRCFALSPLVRKVSVELNDELRRILIVTSDGVRAEDAQPYNCIYAAVVAEKNGRLERGSSNRGGRMDASFYSPQLAEEMAREAVEDTLTRFDAVPGPAGEMPVVLGPGAPGLLLHEAIGHGLEADTNWCGASVFSQMVGKKVAEPFVRIVDDATIPRQNGSINVDDDGTPGKCTVLVENGILTGYMHDRVSAKNYSVESTGNGRRESFRHVVMPRMRNTIMYGGEARPEDVIASVKRGIYVAGVGNGSVNTAEGSFSFYVLRGNLIENGKLTALIKDVNIIGNALRVLRDIAMVANDMRLAPSAGRCIKGDQSIPIGVGLPTVLVKSLTVGGVKS